MVSINRPPFHRIMLIQLAILLPVCSALYFIDVVVAYSSFLGGVVCLIPNAYFASYAFRYSGARSVHAVARAFYWGETGKFTLTVLGFGSAFLLIKPLNVIALFSMYGLMTVIQIIGAARITGPQSR